MERERERILYQRTPLGLNYGERERERMSEGGRGERASARERESASSSRSPPRALVLLKHLQKQSRLLFFVVEKFRNLKWDARVCTICLLSTMTRHRCYSYLYGVRRHFGATITRKIRERNSGPFLVLWYNLSAASSPSSSPLVSPLFSPSSSP